MSHILNLDDVFCNCLPDLLENIDVKLIADFFSKFKIQQERRKNSTNQFKEIIYMTQDNTNRLNLNFGLYFSEKITCRRTCCKNETGHSQLTGPLPA